MNKPQDRPLIKGTIADYYLDAEGILYSYSKSQVRTVENITANIALVKEITGGKKVPLLIYLCSSPVPDGETRKFAADQLPHVYTAMAMVSSGSLSKLIMNILFRVKPPSIPMKSFSDDVLAREWLRQYL